MYSFSIYCYQNVFHVIFLKKNIRRHGCCFECALQGYYFDCDMKAEPSLQLNIKHTNVCSNFSIQNYLFPSSLSYCLCRRSQIGNRRDQTRDVIGVEQVIFLVKEGSIYLRVYFSQY